MDRKHKISSRIRPHKVADHDDVKSPKRKKGTTETPAIPGIIGNRAFSQWIERKQDQDSIRKQQDSDPEVQQLEHEPSSPASSPQETGEKSKSTDEAKITLYFKQNSSQPGKELEKIDRVLLIAKDPECTLQLTGHASTEGDIPHNQNLSEQRASAVESYLIAMGIAANRIKTKALGETQPDVEENAQKGSAELEKQRALNRRVVVILSRKGDANKRLMDLQAWMNRTITRSQKNYDVTVENLNRAKTRLAKYMANPEKWNPGLLVDAQEWVDSNVIAVEEESKNLEELIEASQDPSKANSVLLKKRNIATQKRIELCQKWEKRLEERLDQAREKFNAADSPQKKAFWKKIMDEYVTAKNDIVEVLAYLKRDLEKEKQ